MRPTQIVLPMILCSGVASALCASESGAAPVVEARPGCESRNDWGCTAADVRVASESALRAAGPMMAVSCGPRWEETPVDSAYMQACVERVRELSLFLSEKWSEVLEPIDVATLRYDWNMEFGCVDFVFDDGRSDCLCPVHGQARIPLSWRASAPGTP